LLQCRLQLDRRETYVIHPEDRVELPFGVELRDGLLVDAVRGVHLPVNDSGRIVLERANGATIERLGAELTRAGSRDGVRDALAFCKQLNERFLLNIRVGAATRLRRRLHAFGYGIVLRGPARRVRAESTFDVVRVVSPVGAILTLSLLPLALVGGPWTLAAAAATGLGVVVHEVAHAVALRGVPSAVVLHGLRPTLLHPRLGAARALLVASVGPLAPSLTAIAAAAAWRPSALAVAPLGAHALALTVLCPDGRNACGLS
jgi:hypothetical protein